MAAIRSKRNGNITGPSAGSILPHVQGRYRNRQDPPPGHFCGSPPIRSIRPQYSHRRSRRQLLRRPSLLSCCKIIKEKQWHCTLYQHIIGAHGMNRCRGRDAVRFPAQVRVSSRHHRSWQPASGLQSGFEIKQGAVPPSPATVPAAWWHASPPSAPTKASPASIFTPASLR